MRAGAHRQPCERDLQVPPAVVEFGALSLLTLLLLQKEMSGNLMESLTSYGSVIYTMFSNSEINLHIIIV